MKLSVKISLLTVGVTTAAIAACCLFIIVFTKQTTFANEINTGIIDQQRFMSQFIGEFPDDIDKAEAISMRSYIIYKFKNCYGSEEYTLQNDEGILVNNSGIDAKIAIDKSSKTMTTEHGTSISYTMIRHDEGTFLLIGQSWQQDDEEYYISLVRDTGDIITGLQALIRNCIIVCAVVIIGAAIFILYSVRRALAPLKALSRSAERISNGAYDGRIQIAGKDEIAQLAYNFNNMAVAIQQHIEELEATSEQRRLLLSALSHELKTPVTAIVGFAQALVASKMSSAQKTEAACFIEQESRRLERLSQKLAQLIVLDSADLQLREIKCEDFTNEINHILIPIAQKSGIRLSVKSDSDFIHIEQDLMICLITNLFDNSKKAHATEVSVGVERHRIIVADNGRGIPNEQIDKVMQPFYTLDKSRTGESFGLGLALARKIADLHRADFIIESNVDVGTSIAILFP